ncbi:MAG: hypothetical protein JSR97_01285 [Verrucomicrobia bacterium]|nr:hypothetical protein [Verrucomicrobiota bacterium]
MAKLNGILKIEGTLQDMTFYKTQDGHLVKTKSGVSGDRIANDPAFARTRENGSEFGSAATAGKLLRDAVRTMVSTASDNRVTSRITQIMTQIKNLDTTSMRGDRTVDVGIGTPEGKALLKDLNFNDKAILGAILYKPYAVNTSTGVISIANLVPINDIAAPSGSTHVSFKGAFAIVDFAAGTSDVGYTNVENLPIDGTSTSVTLTPASVPSGTGIKLFLLQVEFFQEVNAVQYSLNNGAYNGLAIIEVV